MGFFKKIGQGVKKFAKKNIRFKNLVKVAGMVDPSGLVKGMSDAHEMKKQAKAEQNAQAQYDANQMANEQGQKFGEFAGTLAGNMIRGAGQSALNGVNQGTQDVIGYGGAMVMENSISQFFKKHWPKIIGVVIGLPLFFIAVKKLAK